jgi:hypothetical protein
VFLGEFLRSAKAPVFLGLSVWALVLLMLLLAGGGSLVAAVDCRRRFVSQRRSDALDLAPKSPVLSMTEGDCRTYRRMRHAEQALRSTGAYRGAADVADARREAFPSEPAPGEPSAKKEEAVETSWRRFGIPLTLSIAFTFTATAGAVVKSVSSTTSNNVYNLPLSNVTFPSPSTTSSVAVSGPLFSIFGQAQPVDCLAYYVELDELAEDDVRLARRLPPNALRGRTPKCGSKNPPTVRRLIRALERSR